jgi:hypothetical protein
MYPIRCFSEITRRAAALFLRQRKQFARFGVPLCPGKDAAPYIQQPRALVRDIFRRFERRPPFAEPSQPFHVAQPGFRKRVRIPRLVRNVWKLRENICRGFRISELKQANSKQPAGFGLFRAETEGAKRKPDGSAQIPAFRR